MTSNLQWFVNSICFAGISNENGEFTAKKRRIGKKGVSAQGVLAEI